jgi:nucleoid-associated protein EbfC
MADPQMPDLGGLLQAAQKMQEEVGRVQERLGTMRVEAGAGGGMVVAVANGRQELISVRIDPQVVDRAEVGMLQDLVLTAVNQALARSRDLAAAELAKVTGGLGLPAGLGL